MQCGIDESIFVSFEKKQTGLKSLTVYSTCELQQVVSLEL